MQLIERKIKRNSQICREKKNNNAKNQCDECGRVIVLMKSPSSIQVKEFETLKILSVRPNSR